MQKKPAAKQTPPDKRDRGAKPRRAGSTTARARQSGRAAAAPKTVGLKKQYLKGEKVCKVTFRLPGVAASNAQRVCIVGDFNDWNATTHQMKKLKNGDYTIKLNLEAGRQYQFRYYIDECRWENDWQADSYTRSPYGDSDNSVVVV